MTNAPDRHARTMLPIPDRPAPGLTTYDAKDPDTAFAPIEPLLPPAGAPNVLIVLLDDVGFGAASTFGGPCNTPTADRLAAGGLKYNRFHTTALCAPTRAALLSGRNHHSVGMGSITETATSAPGEQFGAAEHEGAVGDDAEVERVLDGAVRQVPRGAGVAVVADGSVRCVAVGRRGVRVVLRVHRWREQPVGSGAVRRYDTCRAAGHAGGGVSPDRGPGRPGDQLGASAEGADARQAVLRLLRAGRDARPAPRPQGVGRQVRGPVRRRVGRAARAHVRPTAGARGDPRRRRADRPACRDHGVGRHARRAEAGAGPRDGGVRRVPRAHRPPRRSADRRRRGPRDPRRHDHLLHHRRQRRVRRGHDERRVQRDGQLQRDGRPGDAGVHAVQDGRVRLAQLVQPLLGGLGVGDVHPVPVDQAGRLALGRHAQRNHRPLAQRHRGAGRAAQPVHPRHRRRPDDPRGGRPARADDGQRRAAVPDGGHQHAVHVQRRRGAGTP